MGLRTWAREMIIGLQQGRQKVANTWALFGPQPHSTPALANTPYKSINTFILRC